MNIEPFTHIMRQKMSENPKARIRANKHIFIASVLFSNYGYRDENGIIYIKGDVHTISNLITDAVSMDRCWRDIMLKDYKEELDYNDKIKQEKKAKIQLGYNV